MSEIKQSEWPLVKVGIPYVAQVRSDRHILWKRLPTTPGSTEELVEALALVTPSHLLSYIFNYSTVRKVE